MPAVRIIGNALSYWDWISSSKVSVTAPVSKMLGVLPCCTEVEAGLVVGIAVSTIGVVELSPTAAEITGVAAVLATEVPVEVAGLVEDPGALMFDWSARSESWRLARAYVR